MLLLCMQMIFELMLNKYYDAQHIFNLFIKFDYKSCLRYDKFIEGSGCFRSNKFVKLYLF